MGEHSIIIPETRVIDRESGSRVVCRLTRDFTAGGRARSAGGLRIKFGPIDDGWGGAAWRGSGGTAPVQCATNRPSERIYGTAKRRRNCHRNSVLRTRRHVCSPGTNVRLSQSFVLLVLSYFGLSRGSSSLVPTPRTTSLQLSGSWVALVSLLVVGLLRPIVAVPATSNMAVGAADGGATNVDTTLARIMPGMRDSANAASGGDEDERLERYVAETMSRRRLGVEDLDNDYYHDDDDEDDDDTMQLPAPPPPSPSLMMLPQRTRESGLESRSRIGEAELDTVRRSIVEGLGLERIPDPSKANVSQTEYRRAHVEYLTRLHSRAGKDDRLRKLHTFHPTERLPETMEIRMYNRTRRSPHSEASNDDLEDEVAMTSAPADFVYFSLNNLDDEAMVEHANLRFFIDPTNTRIDDDNYDIFLHRLTADSRQFVSRHKLPIGLRGPRWIEIDATELTSMWHEYGVENRGIELTFVRTSKGGLSEKPRISLTVMNVFVTRPRTNNDDGGGNPRGRRTKRRASPDLPSLHKGTRTDCRGENKKCCRHEMTVIFKDLKGFEFIVQPKNFDAGYCKGRCPPRYNPAHHHAVLQSLIWKADKRKAPRPCCAPSKLDELEILYFDENDPTKLKVSSWKNMKVLECACS